MATARSKLESPPDGIVVFVGPTIPQTVAREILPNALYLPPAQCGDLVRVLRLAPRAVLIIDGVYERTPAVWHKEIALALERGVRMCGAASMGALRAAEMDAYGMLGFGTVYAAYRDGCILDDDEVAVVHTAGGDALSQAMVDIRATVERAVRERRITPATATSVLAAAKQLFYPERTLRAAIAALPDSAELRSFSAWAEHGGGWVDRKRQDAALALSELACYEREGWPEPRRQLNARVPHTVSLFALQRDTDCRPIRGLHPALPLRERVLQAARFCGPAYGETKHVARLLAALHDVARARGLDTADDDAGGHAEPLWRAEMSTPAWAAANDCDAGEQQALRRRLLAIERLELIALAPPHEPRALLRWQMYGGLERYERWLGIFSAAACPPTDAPDPDATARRTLIARLWRIIDRLAQNAGMVPAPDVLALLLTGMRGALRLADENTTASALSNLDLRELGALLLAQYRWGALAIECQLVALGVRDLRDAGVVWLLDAARVCGLYPRARELLGAPDELRQKAAILPNNLGQALARDFDTAEPALLRRQLRALC